jgi:hypothetical protein
MFDRDRVVGLVGAALGLAALLLPFADEKSPMKVLYWVLREPPWRVEWWYPAHLVAAPAFLAIPIAAYQVRRTTKSPPGRVAVALAYLFAGTAMLHVLIICLAILPSYSQVRVMLTTPPSYVTFSWAEVASSLLAPIVPMLLVLANAVLLVRNRRNHLRRHDVAEIFLLGSYLPGAALAMLLLVHWLQFGAYVVLATSIVYVARAILLLRASRSGRGRL